MKESKIGSILALIGGILTLVGALAILVIGILVGVYGSSIDGANGDATAAVVIVIFLFIALVVLGVLKIYASRMMTVPHRTMNGGILALVTGILSGGDLLAIIGGILGIVEGGK